MSMGRKESMVINIKSCQHSQARPHSCDKRRTLVANAILICHVLFKVSRYHSSFWRHSQCFENFSQQTRAAHLVNCQSHELWQAVSELIPPTNYSEQQWTDWGYRLTRPTSAFHCLDYRKGREPNGLWWCSWHNSLNFWNTTKLYIIGYWYGRYLLSILAKYSISAPLMT